MRLLTAYIGRELLLAWLAILFVLLLVILGGELARLLTEALEGRIAADLVLQLVLLKIPVAMEILLPLATLLAVMITFGRLYHDREMEVMSASGIGDRYFLRLVMRMAAVVALLAAGSALLISPWAMQQENHIFADTQLKAQVKALSGGRFTPLNTSNGIFYAEKISKHGELQDIFIQLRPDDHPDLLLTAPMGKFIVVGDRTQLVLEGGQVASGLLAPDQVQLQYFEKLTISLPEWQAKQGTPEVESLATSQLWASPDDPKMMAHLQWRLFVGLSVLLMAWAGWHLAKVGPRQGRYSRMAYGLGFYLIFTQLAITVRAEIQRGELSVFPGMLVVVLLVLLFLLPWRDFWYRIKLHWLSQRGTS